MTLYNDTTNYYLGTRIDASWTNFQTDLQALGAAALGNNNYFSHNAPASFSNLAFRIAFHPADAIDPDLTGVSVTSVGSTTGQFGTSDNPSAGWRFAATFNQTTSTASWLTAVARTNTSTNSPNKQALINGPTMSYTPTMAASSHFFAVMDNRSFIFYATTDQFSSVATSVLYWIGVTNDNHPTEITELWLRSGAMINQTASGAFQQMNGWGQSFGNYNFYSILPRGTSVTANFLTPFAEVAGQPDFGEGQTANLTRVITQYYHRIDQPALNQYTPGRVNNLAIAEGASGSIILNATYVPDSSLGTGNNLWRCVGFLPYPSGSRPRYLMLRTYNP